MKLLPSQRVLCSPYNHAPCHFMKSHICKVHACLAVTCHLHFWQNDRDLLCPTAVIRGVERIPKSLPSRRRISCHLSRDSNPQPFNHKSGTLTIELPRSLIRLMLPCAFLFFSVALSLMMIFSGCIGCKHYFFFYVARSRAYYFMPAPDTQSADSLAVFQYYKIRCSGDESTLSQCPLQYTSSGCLHDRDVGVSCNTG